jgi:hypothetical protein
MKKALKEAKKTSTYVKGKTKQPAITADVLQIVRAMPLGYPDRDRDASLFLTSLETGARAMTVESGMSIPYYYYVQLKFISSQVI